MLLGEPPDAFGDLENTSNPSLLDSSLAAAEDLALLRSGESLDGEDLKAGENKLKQNREDALVEVEQDYEKQGRMYKLLQADLTNYTKEELRSFPRDPARSETTSSISALASSSFSLHSIR